MSSASSRRQVGSGRIVVPIALAVAALAGAIGAQQQSGRARADPRPTLRVCADPNNLPFSNRRLEGFENRIAEQIAAELGMPLAYRWFPQRRGFVRHTLNAQLCDLIIGVPTGYDLVARTAPYYRSSYVFVTRADRRLDVRSFDDPALRTLRIGVHMMGDDYANSPAALALARRGLRDRIVPFMIYGDYDRPDPPTELVTAVARGEIDVAVAWGPLAGWVASRSAVPLRVHPVATPSSAPTQHFTFDIAMGVRHGDTARLAELDLVLARRAPEIRRILASYGVPTLALATATRRAP